MPKEIGDTIVRGPFLHLIDVDEHGPLLQLMEAEATTAQVYLFAKDKFDMAAVKAWLKEKKIKAHKITEESDDAEFIHARVAEPEDFKPKSFRTIEIADGIKLRIGKLKEAMHGEMPSMVGNQMDETKKLMLAGLRFDTKKFKNDDTIIKWAGEHGTEIPKIKVPELNITMPLIDRFQDYANVQFGEYHSGKHVSGEVDDGVTATVCIPRDMALHEAIEQLEEAGARHTKAEMSMIEQMIAMLKKLKDGKEPDMEDMSAEDKKMGKDIIKMMFKESLNVQGRITEAKDEDGSQWEVCLIEAGKSKNGRTYPKEVLSNAAKMFEGRPACIYGRNHQGEVVHDHLTNQEVSANPKGFVRHVVGVYKGVKMQGDRLMATLHIFDDSQWLKDKLRAAWTAGASKLFGLSIDASGEADDNGTVLAFNGVDSVDLVTYPAAEGGIVAPIRLAASALMYAVDAEGKGLKIGELLQRFSEALAKCTAEQIIQLKEADKDSFGKIRDALLSGDRDSHSLTETEMTRLAANLKLLFEGKAPEATQVAAAAVNPPAVVAPPAANGGGNGGTTAGGNLAAEMVTKLREFDERMAALKKQECKMILSIKLAESKLPAKAKDRLRARFNDRLFEQMELDAAHEEYCDLLATQVATGGRVSESGATHYDFGKDEWDKTLEMADDLWKPGIHQVSLKETVQRLSGSKDLSCLKRTLNPAIGRFAEAMTVSSWAEILKDSMVKSIIPAYQADNYMLDAKKIVGNFGVVPLETFLTYRRVRMGGLASLSSVAEGGTYTEATAITDEEITYALGKYGNLWTITLEMIANDNLGAIRRFPKEMSDSAGYGVYQFVFDFLKNNTAYEIDSVALAHADHSNTSTSAFTYTTYLTGRSSMREQGGYQHGRKLGLIPRYLVVPAELEGLANEIANSGKKDERPDTGDRATTVVKAGELEVIVCAYWTDANNVWMVADAAKVPTIELGFFQGRENPDVFIQDLPAVGAMFDADQVKYKVRHIYGGDIIDYRGFYGFIVA